MSWRICTRETMCAVPRRLVWLLLIPAVLLSGCSKAPLDDPYPASQVGKNILYGSFTERPKHLDPAQSYSANEYEFISQIYEPPLQYHFLRRPYELVPLAATAVPKPYYEDAQGHRLPDDAPADKIAYSIYRITIKRGMHYQPHPAFARDAKGHYLYHHLTADDLKNIYKLSDFPKTGTREVTAADYVYEIKRFVAPRVNCPIAGIMGEHIDGLKALGKRLASAYRAKWGDDTQPHFLDLRKFHFPGARVISRYTYEIKLDGKYPQFRYWLAMPFFAPMPWEALAFYSQPGMEDRTITLDWYPVGSGPYMLTENNPNRQMVLERNPNFHGERYPSHGMPGDRAAGMLKDAGKPLPFVDKAVFSLEQETIPYWNKFLQGYYDTSGIASDNFDQAIHFGSRGEAELTRQMRAKGIKLSTAPMPSTFYMGFNMLDPVVGGYTERARKLRRAISIAVNYEDYISIFANGRGVPAQGPIPPGIFGFIKGKAGINPYVYDWVNGKAKRKPLADARRLLAEAGYPDGRDAKTGDQLVLYFDTAATGPESKSNLDWLRKQFAKLGIQLVIRNTDYNRFQDKMQRGTEQIYQWGWNADYPDPENFLFLLYGPNGEVKYHGENASNYENPRYDKLFEKMKDMPDTPARQAVINRMVAIARRDAPWIWGFHPVQYVLHHSWFHNAELNMMANNTLKYRRIDPALRAKLRVQWNRPVLWPILALLGLLLLSAAPAVVIHRRRERSTAL